MPTHCPTCGQKIMRSSRRICADCGKPIKRYDKWYFGEDSRIRHRSCVNPQGYVTAEAAASLSQRLPLEVSVK